MKNLKDCLLESLNMENDNNITEAQIDYSPIYGIIDKSFNDEYASVFYGYYGLNGANKETIDEIAARLGSDAQTVQDKYIDTMVKFIQNSGNSSAADLINKIASDTVNTPLNTDDNDELNPDSDGFGEDLENEDEDPLNEDEDDDLSKSIEEGEISSEEDFKEYAQKKFEEVFGDDLDEDQMNETIDGILSDNKDLVDEGEWGSLVGILNKSFAN